MNVICEDTGSVYFYTRDFTYALESRCRKIVGCLFIMVHCCLSLVIVVLLSFFHVKTYIILASLIHD